MSSLKKYIILFAGLQEGVSYFNFMVDEKFFDNFSETEIKKGKVKVKIEIKKDLSIFEVMIKIKGSVELVCDRCLDNFDYDINELSKLIVKIDNEKGEDGDEIITITEAEGEVNFAQYIYEYLHLALPIKRVHQEVSQCNREITEKLKAYQKKGKEEIDPRWEALKKIKFN